MESQAKSHDKETSPMLSRTCYQKLPQNWGGVRVSYSTKFYTGRHRPEIQPLTLLYTIFGKKGTLYHSHKLSFCQPFWALLQTEMTDFPTLSKTSTSEIPTL